MSKLMFNAFRHYSKSAKPKKKQSRGLIAYLTKYPEVIPLGALVIGEAINFPWLLPYIYFTRQEAPLYVGPRKKYPFDEVDTLRHPSHPKLLKFNQTYEPLPELAEIYERMQEKERELEECKDDDEGESEEKQ